MRFAYDDSYHMDLSMVLYKVMCDDHAGCLSIGQVQRSISLWISGHMRFNRKVRTICKRASDIQVLFEDCIDFFR